MAHVKVDIAVAFFAIGIGVATVVLFGLWPVVSLLRTRLSESAGDRGGGLTRANRRWASLLLAAEVALALVLVVTASLFGESFLRLSSQPLGFEPSNVAVLSTVFTGDPYGGRGASLTGLIERGDTEAFAEAEQALRLSTSTAMTTRVLDHLKRQPGVLDVAGVRDAPFAAAGRDSSISDARDPDRREHRAQWQVVTEGYFTTLRIPILEGRGFLSTDRAGDRAVVVSRELAHAVFNNAALGRELTSGGLRYEIVGVAEDVKQSDYADGPHSTFYTLDRQVYGVSHFVVRMDRSADSALDSLRSVLGTAVPQLVVTRVSSMPDDVARSLDVQKLRATLSSGFGVVALTLAAIGLYAFATRQVIERRREVGLRMALGAQPLRIWAHVVRSALLPVGGGLLVGVVVATGVGRVAQSLLYGVVDELRVFLMASTVLVVVALVAVGGPAAKAAGMDPAATLRG
jgi:hypothetical protein